jgi:hypothetical protein
VPEETDSNDPGTWGTASDALRAACTTNVIQFVCKQLSGPVAICVVVSAQVTQMQLAKSLTSAVQPSSVRSIDFESSLRRPFVLQFLILNGSSGQIIAPHLHR